MTKAAILKLSDYREKMQVESPSIKEMDADKLAKDSIEVEKRNLTSTEILNKSIQDLAKIIKQQGALGKVTDKAKDTKFFGGAGGAIKERVDNVKDFFTLRGFLDKTGIVSKGSTGLISGVADKALEKREAKQQYVSDMMKTDPTVRLLGPEKAKEKFKERFEKIQPAGLAVEKNEKELERLRSAGLTEEQVQRSPEYKKKAELEANLAKVDPRFRGKDTLSLTKDSKQTSKDKSNVVPLFSKSSDEDNDKVSETLGESREGEIEASRQMEEQTAVLKQIEENTRPIDVKPQKPESGDDKGGGLFGGLIDKVKTWALGFGMAFLGKLKVMSSLIGKGILSGARALFSGGALLKLVSKFFLPAAIVGTIASGLIDGVKKFVETGSITEALIAGLGGMLSFLTFGLVDGETIKNLVSGFTNLVDEYITQPLANFFNNIKEAVVGFIEGIGIPEIGFSVFGKKIKIGPWYPFKKDDAPAEPETPSAENKGPRVEGKESDGAKSDVKPTVDGKATSQPGTTSESVVPGKSGATPAEGSKAPGAGPKGMGPNYKAALKDYKDSTPADHLEKQYPGIGDAFRNLAEKYPPRSDSKQMIESHEQMLVLKAQVKVANGTASKLEDKKPLVDATTKEQPTATSAPDGKKLVESAPKEQPSMEGPKPVDATTAAPSGQPIVTRTTKMLIGGDEVIPGKELTNRQMAGITMGLRNGKTDYPPEVIKQYNLQKKAKEEAPKPTAPDVASNPPGSMDSGKVYNQSAENDANRQKSAAGNTNVVMAPTNNSTNNSTTIAPNFTPRGNDSSLNDYIRRRAVY